MKTLLLILSLLLITTNAYAEWTIFFTSVDGDVFFYDKSSVKRNGDKIRVWSYINFSPDYIEAKSLDMGSGRSLEEIDCVNETVKLLALHRFTKTNLEGEIKGRNVPNPTIDYIVPDSVSATLMKLVCKK